MAPAEVDLSPRLGDLIDSQALAGRDKHGPCRRKPIQEGRGKVYLRPLTGMGAPDFLAT